MPRPLWVGLCCVWELVLAAGEAVYVLSVSSIFAGGTMLRRLWEWMSGGRMPCWHDWFYRYRGIRVCRKCGEVRR